MKKEVSSLHLISYCTTRSLPRANLQPPRSFPTFSQSKISTTREVTSISLSSLSLHTMFNSISRHSRKFRPFHQTMQHYSTPSTSNTPHLPLNIFTLSPVTQPSASPAKHVIVPLNRQNQPKNPSYSSSSLIFKYLPAIQNASKSAQIRVQHRICRDDIFETYSYICTDEYDIKQRDVHFQEQFDVDVDLQSRIAMEMRELGERAMKNILKASERDTRETSGTPELTAAEAEKDATAINHSSLELVLDVELASNQAFVEGLLLGNYNFKKILKDEWELPVISVLEEGADKVAWSAANATIQHAAITAQSEMLARFLMDAPSNYKTPTKICDFLQNYFLDAEDVTVTVRDKEWIEEKKMGALLGVSQGSFEEPRIFEVFYNGDKSTDETTLLLCGKGITFDTGGISIKPAKSMKMMKGDMGGAACMMSAIRGIAKLRPNINVRAIAAFCENMPDGRAVKPGDVIRSMKGTTIEVDNTDAEGRLILADALYYSTSTYKPNYVVNAATLTGAMVVALGSVSTGVFSTHNALWRQLERAGAQTNDFMWRMPLFSRIFVERLKSDVSDLNNMSNKAEAGSAAAAAFLTQFVDFRDDKKQWPQFSHLDIAGTAMSGNDMTGRPTRALIQLALNLSEEKAQQKDSKGENV